MLGYSVELSVKLITGCDLTSIILLYKYNLFKQTATLCSVHSTFLFCRRLLSYITCCLSLQSKQDLQFCGATRKNWGLVGLYFEDFVYKLLTKTCLIFALDSGYVDLRLNAGCELRTQTFWESTQTNRIWDFVLRFEAWLLKSTETLSAQKWNVMAIYCYGCSERCTWHLVVILFQKRWRCVLHELHVCHCQSSSSFIIQRVDHCLGWSSIIISFNRLSYYSKMSCLQHWRMSLFLGKSTWHVFYSTRVPRWSIIQTIPGFTNQLQAKQLALESAMTPPVFYSLTEELNFGTVL